MKYETKVKWGKTFLAIGMALGILWLGSCDIPQAKAFSGDCAIDALGKGKFLFKNFPGDTTGFGLARDYCLRSGGGVITVGPGCETKSFTWPLGKGILVLKSTINGWYAIPDSSAGGSGGSLNLWPGVKVVDNISYAATAAGINLAINQLPNRGGAVIILADSVLCGANSINITKGNVTLLGMGGRSTVLSYTGSGRFINIGSDDGNHSGANAYDGIASNVTLKGFRIMGPGKATNATAITDWDSGSNTYDDLTIDSWGYGYFGIGADVSIFQNKVLFSNNTIATYLGSRSDQNTFNHCYWTQNTHGILNQWAYGMRVTDCQFVFSDSSDITYDVTASPAGSGDTRSGSQRAIIEGSWFENLSATSPPRHLRLGINGTSARVLTGLTITGCQWFSSNADTFLSVQAFGDINLYGNGYSGVAATFIRVNPVSGWAPIIQDDRNHMSSVITPLAGTGDTTYVYRVAPSSSSMGWVFKDRVTTSSIVTSRLGPYSTSTTGGAIRIVDGVTFPLTVTGVQTALNECGAAGGGTTMLPATANIQISNVGIKIPNRVRILGMGTVVDSLPTFDCTATCNVGAIIENAKIDGTQAYVGIENISVQGDTSGTATDSIGIRLRSVFWHSYLEKVQVRFVKGSGIVMDDPGSHGFGPIQMDQVVIGTLAKSTLGDGIRVGSKTVGVWNGVTISNSGVERWGTGAAAVRFLGNCAVSASFGGSIKDMYLEQYSDALADGIVLDGVSNTVVDQISFNGAGAINYPIKITGSTLAICGTYGNIITNVYTNNDTLLFDQTNNKAITNADGKTLFLRYTSPVEDGSSNYWDIQPSISRTSIASATTLVLTKCPWSDTNVTGTTTVTNITGNDCFKSKIIRLWTTAALQFTDGGDLNLNGNFNGDGAGGADWLELQWDGTNFNEVGRSIN